MAKGKKIAQHKVRAVVLPEPYLYNINWYSFSAVLATFVTYISSALTNGFSGLDDDVKYVTENPLIRTWNIGGCFAEKVYGTWGPLHQFFLMIQYHLFGLDATGYHLMSLGLHMINVRLVFRLVFKLSKKQVTAGIVALLWGIHPMHVESVAWVSAQKDLLYTLFGLLALLAYLKHKDSPSIKYLVRAGAYFILSCLSKGMGVTLPLVLVLLDSYIAADRSLNFMARSLRNKFLFLAAAVPVVWYAIVAQDRIGAINSQLTAHHTFGERVMFASYGLIVYAAKLFVPVDPHPMYLFPLRDVHGMYPWIYRLSPIVLVLAAFYLGIVMLRRLRKKQSNDTAVFGLGFFLITMLPLLVSQLFFPVGFAILAERYTYLSYLGPLFIIATKLNAWWERYEHKSKRLMLTGYGSLVLAFGVMTYAYAGEWGDPIKLWTDVIENTQTIPEEEVSSSYDRKKSRRKKSLHEGEAYVSAYISRASLYYQLGKYRQATDDCTMALVFDPESAQAYNNRGMARVYLKEFNQALEDITHAIALDSTVVQYVENRKFVYSEKEKSK